MKVTIHFKTNFDLSVPFCAFTCIGGIYRSAWSIKSYEEAERTLIERLKVEFEPKTISQVPLSKEVEI